MPDRSTSLRRPGVGILVVLTLIIAAAVFFFTYTSIQRSRLDRFALFHDQSQTLLQTLVETVDNSITANRFYWEAFVARVSPIAHESLEKANAEQTLRDFNAAIPDITLLAVYHFDDRLGIISSTLNTAAGDFTEPLEELFDAARDLLADTTHSRSLVFMPDTVTETAQAILVELDSARASGVCLLLEAPELWEMENQAGINSLISKLGETGSVEYIFFQTRDGLVFSSLPVDSLAPIAVDTFLQQALVSDTIVSRMYQYGDVETFELVAPFASELYSKGVFRLGMSMVAYHAEVSEFNRQMIIFGSILFLLAALIPLYFGIRRERTELGASLAESRSISASMLGSMHSGALALSPDGQVVLTNQRIIDDFALGDEPIGGRDIRATSLGALLPRELYEFTPSPARAGEFGVTINGQTKHFLYSVSPINFPGSKKNEPGSGRAIVVYDYTRQKELEEESARRKRLAELGDLAAGVAHEIRNPLNAISLSAQRLDAEFSGQINAEKDQFSFFTSQIKSETQRLNEIVTRLLDLTRAPKSENAPIDVAPIIRDWAAFMRPEVERDRITMKLELDESITARVDRNKLRQTLGNLYRNAVEAYTGENDSTSPLTITIQLQTVDNVPTIRFADDGPGVPAGVGQNIFTPYFTTKESGSGLGLAICYRLISDMSGELYLDESYTDGAQFIIKLNP